MRAALGLAWAAFGVLVSAMPAWASDPSACKAPRFADIGWTDITATTAVATRVLAALDYTPKIQTLSVPATYMSLKNKDIDIFLGNWMPSMEADRHAYTYADGLKTFGDVAKFKDRLNGKIYGLEPGNDGDRIVLKMIRQDDVGLGSFELAESNEQGMLAQLDGALRRKEPIVFLGWEPHPMNTKYQIKYLDDPDNHFGPDNGAATVSTNVRGGYVAECPNIGKFLQNLHFTLPMEDEMMGAILFDGAEPAKAAEAWLRANKPVWSGWLGGVTTLDGDPAVPALSKSLGLGS